MQANNTAAILTTFNEVDMSAVMALRARYKEKFQESYGVSLGFMSFFARAAAMAAVFRPDASLGDGPNGRTPHPRGRGVGCRPGTTGFGLRLGAVAVPCCLRSQDA